MIHLLGEPLTSVDFKEGTFHFPIGQIRAYERTLKESTSQALVENELRLEYRAIIAALNEMGIDFRIPLLDPGPPDRSFLIECQREFGCRTTPFGSFPPGIMAYPRNFCTVVERAKLILLNNRVVERVNPKMNGWNFAVSPYGDSGYVYVKGSTMIIGDISFNVSNKEVALIERTGMNVGIFPPAVTAIYSRFQNDTADRIMVNGHIDRVSCLLADSNGKLHLIVDPKIETADLDAHNQWFVRDNVESLSLIKNKFQTMDINVCCPSEITVPCALNMHQFGDGRVLMTAGDEEVRSLVESIVGVSNVVETARPIEFLPLWKRAGIGCMLNKIPASFING
ncbi:MAG: hypothetical protein WCX69_03325 [Candidatus Paceibacterota bacterium]